MNLHQIVPATDPDIIWMDQTTGFITPNYAGRHNEFWRPCVCTCTIASTWTHYHLAPAYTACPPCSRGNHHATPPPHLSP
jgi:hypothetical protein